MRKSYTIKKFALTLFASLFTIGSSVIADGTSNIYSVAKVYELIELDDDDKTIDAYGNIEDSASAILTPMYLKVGRYEVTVKRLDYNFYKVVDMDIVIETRGCYEYATREDVILNITSSSEYSYQVGELIFFD